MVFKTRVKHFSMNYYKVQYAHYRFLLKWNDIDYFFCASFLSNLECWSTKLFGDYKNAELFASKMEKLEDVLNYYKEETQKQENFLLEQKKYIEDNIPYESKIIR